ncbi:MAG: hypothetical protein HY879_00045 [Deltaproteobacteria bacterium]|nr:hypothetical protein [Deltaproteobacteria bacterium]
MANIRPIFITKLKAPFLAAFFLFFSLSACSPSFLADPAARYLKKKSGIELKTEKVSIGINPLRLEIKGAQIKYHQGHTSWDVKMPGLQAVFGWTLSWENLPWPDFHIKKLTINQPQILIRMPEKGEGGDWLPLLKKLPAFKRIEIRDLQGRVKVGENDFQLAPGTHISASFSPDQGADIEYQIKNIRGQWSPEGLKFQTRSKGSINLSDLQDKPKWKGSITLSEGHFSSREGKIDQVSGELGFLYHKGLFEISASSIRAGEIQGLIRGLSFQGRGKMDLSGSIRFKNPDQKVGFLSNGLLNFEKLDFEVNEETRTIKGQADGQVRISGPAINPLIAGKLKVLETDLNLSPVHIQGLETEIEIQGKIPDLSFPFVRARAGQTNIHLTSGPLPIVNPETRFSARLSDQGRQILLKDLWLKTANWGLLSGSLDIEPFKGPIPSGKIRLEGFPLLQFLKIFSPEAALPFSREIPCQGTLAWSQEAAGSPGIFQLSLIPAPFSFQIPDTDFEGEDLKTQIDVQGKWLPEDQTVQGVLNQHLSGGSLFRPPWLFNFDQSRLTARMEGSLKIGHQAPSLTGSLNLEYDPLGTVIVSGEWPIGSRSRSFSGSMEIKNLPLEKGYPLLVGGPFSYDYPFLKRLSPQGLLTAYLFASKKNEAYELRGRLTGSGIDLDSREPFFSIEDLHFDLPFHLTSPEIDPGKRVYADPGFIQVGSLKGPDLTANKLLFPVLVRTNQFELPDRIQVPLYGGWLSLNAFKLLNPLGDLKIETALSLKDMDLIQMFKGPAIPGRLNGHWDPIRIDKEKAQIEGTLTADIFEGMVEGGNWTILHPFSQERVIQGDLFFNHLNLEAITRQFSFGKITGFVQGQMTALSLRNNQPEQFNLVIRTQEIPGVPKRIHIKAIENISLLGTGWGELDVLRQGINRWINEYEYREIGLVCTLKEDRFRLHGAIIEEGLEYLVRRPGWFGIDIINKNPENEISFSDIMDRIHRIGRKAQEETGDEKK